MPTFFMTYEEIVQRIAAARTARKLSRRAMAEAAHVDMVSESVRLIENGTNRTSTRNLAAFCKAVGLRLIVMVVDAEDERVQLWLRTYRYCMEADERDVRLGLRSMLKAWEDEQEAAGRGTRRA